jgi:putative ATPase
VVKAINSAVEYVENNRAGDVPPHLKDSHYAGASDLGHGLDYKYPHSYSKNYVKQNYLPEDMQDIYFYEPGQMGREKKTAQFLKYLKNKNGTKDDK